MPMAIASAGPRACLITLAAARAPLWRSRPVRTGFTSLRCTRKQAHGATATGARIFRVRYVNPLALDYDIDGDVDNNDYEVWRANLGSNLLLAADGNKNAVVDAGDYVLWRKAMPAGSAAGASVTSLSVAATTNDSAAAPSTPPGDIPTTISNDMTPGVSAQAAKNQMRVPASVGAIDMAMGAFPPSKCRRTHAPRVVCPDNYLSAQKRRDCTPDGTSQDDERNGTAFG